MLIECCSHHLVSKIQLTMVLTLLCLVHPIVGCPTLMLIIIKNKRCWLQWGRCHVSTSKGALSMVYNTTPYPAPIVSITTSTCLPTNRIWSLSTISPLIHMLCRFLVRLSRLWPTMASETFHVIQMMNTTTIVHKRKYNFPINCLILENYTNHPWCTCTFNIGYKLCSYISLHMLPHVKSQAQLFSLLTS